MVKLKDQIRFVSMCVAVVCLLCLLFVFLCSSVDAEVAPNSLASESIAFPFALVLPLVCVAVFVAVVMKKRLAGVLRDVYLYN